MIARSGGIMHLALGAQQIYHAVQAQGGHCQILLVRHSWTLWCGADKTSPIIPEAKVCQRTEKSRSLCRHPSTAAKNRLSIFCPGQGHECKRSGAHEFEEQRTVQTTHSKHVRRRSDKKKKRAWGVCNHTNTAGSHIGGNHNRALAGFEFTENPVSFGLLLVTVNG